MGMTHSREGTTHKTRGACTGADDTYRHVDHGLPDAISGVLDSHGIDAQSAGRSPDSRSGAKQYVDRRTPTASSRSWRAGSVS